MRRLFLIRGWFLWRGWMGCWGLLRAGCGGEGGGRGGRDVAVGVIGGTEATKSELVPSISAEAKRVKERCW